MKKNFKIISFLKSLLKFSPRQLEGEKKTADFIISFLRNQKIDYIKEYFSTKIPKIEKAILKADEKKIFCQGCCFLGGKIKGKEYLHSSLIPSRFFLEKSNINFNPYCPEISLSNFYFAPALAVSREKVALILKAKKIEGEVKVNKINHKSVHIIVGNLRDPKTISFAHYDSIGKGTIDNASGVAVMMEIILTSPQLLKKNLFIFAGNEELSFNKPNYWGYGYRVFERKFFNIMKKTKKILVIDSVGNGKPNIFRDENSIYLGFNIKNRIKWKRKIQIIAGDFQKLMNVYHSEADDLQELKLKYLKETKEIFKKILY